MLFEEPNLSDNEEVMSILDDILVDVKSRNFSKRKNFTREDTLFRVSGEKLQEVMEGKPGGFSCVALKHEPHTDRLRELLIEEFEKNTDLSYKEAVLQGKTFYPKESFMSWHNDNSEPGYILYCTYAEEDDKSFLRYRNTDTGNIETGWDKKGWHFRIFDINADNPLWHCVFSDTIRFSIGYRFIRN